MDGGLDCLMGLFAPWYKATPGGGGSPRLARSDEQEDGMDCRKLALTIAGGALALYGCGGDTGMPDGYTFPERDYVCQEGAAQPCETTVEAHTEADRTHVEGGGPELSSSTLTFVVNLLSIPSPTDMSPGFNLDQLDSREPASDAEADCEHHAMDYVSTTDPDHVGVDNALAGLLSILGDLDSTLAEQISSGSVLLLIEVTGVDSIEYDSQISLQLYRGQVPGGGMPTLGDDGRLAPDQTFEVMETLGSPVDGDIFDGRVRASVSALPLSLNVMGATVSLTVGSPEVRFDIAAADDGSLTLGNGSIGGILTHDDISMAVNMINPDFVSTVESVWPTYADITPSADDPTVCDAASIGILFEATAATRSGG